jgi:hypothetical protein
MYDQLPYQPGGGPIMTRTGKILLAVALHLTCLAEASALGDESAAFAELIDGEIQASLYAEELQRARPTNDAEFLRRAFLDLHGVVPSADRARRFLDRREDGKRMELVDELLASTRFGEHQADLWCRRLLPQQAKDQRVNRERFSAWLAERFNRNDGWDRIVTELVTATGKIEENPAVIYMIEGRHPLNVADLADLSSRYFLGIRLNCARCHDHPFADWKQKDYWGMAAFFAQIQTPRRPKSVYQLGVRDDRRMTPAALADADALDGFQVRRPTFPAGDELPENSDETHRVALARWMTSSDNPFFARAAVNRLWWHFFGRGIVHPVDDMHSANPASHARLLELLSRRFVESGFNLKLLCGAIVGSRTYQQTSVPGMQPELEAERFARMSIKVLTAEQLYDSLTAILGPPAKATGIDVRHGARYEFCQFFSGDGDPDPTRYDRGIPQLLRLMNSRQFAGGNLDALVARAAPAERVVDAVVEELFLAILARRPSEQERKLVQDQLRDGKTQPRQAYRELAWALLMSSEFSLNR